jgi:glycosyltransferase involved in cell wall biosynthesis
MVSVARMAVPSADDTTGRAAGGGRSATIAAHRMTAARAPARVLYAHNSSEIGGGNRMLLTLLDHLPRERFSACSLIPRRGPLEAELRGRGVPVVRLDALGPLRRRSLISQSTALLGLALELGWRRFDLLHANGPLSYRLPALALRRAAGICHLHLPAPAEALRWAFRRAPAVVIACSEAVGRDAAAGLGDPASAPRLVTLPNAVDLDRFAPASPPFAPRSLPDHDDMVLFCGSLSERKGIEDYLQVAAAVLARRPRSLFVVAGDDLVTAGAHRRRMEELARERGLGERVRFTGFVDDPRPLLQAATLVVLPSRLEGMPLVLLEAAACAKPVVAYRIAGVDELVVDGVDGRLVAVGDVGGLAAATLELLENPELAAAMGGRGRQRVEAHHCARRYAARVVEIYDQLLRRRARGDEAPG